MDQRIREKIDSIKGTEANISALQDRRGSLMEEVVSGAIEIFKALGISPADAKREIDRHSTNEIGRAHV